MFIILYFGLSRRKVCILRKNVTWTSTINGLSWKCCSTKYNIRKWFSSWRFDAVPASVSISHLPNPSPLYHYVIFTTYERLCCIGLYEPKASTCISRHSTDANKTQLIIVGKHYIWKIIQYHFRKVFRIHPSFRIIGMGEPPTSTSNTQNQWLGSDLLSLFLYHHIQPLSKEQEAQIIFKLVCTTEILSWAIYVILKPCF